MLDLFFDLIFKLWDSFWNVSDKLIKLAFFAICCGASAAAFHEVPHFGRAEPWFCFKSGVALGLLCGVLYLLIVEVAVPLVHSQVLSESDRRKLQAKAIFGDTYADDRFKRRR